MFYFSRSFFAGDKSLPYGSSIHWKSEIRNCLIPFFFQNPNNFEIEKYETNKTPNSLTGKRGPFICHVETGASRFTERKGQSLRTVPFVLLTGFTHSAYVPDHIWIRTGRRSIRCQRSDPCGCSTQPIRPARSCKRSEREWRSQWRIRC